MQKKQVLRISIIFLALFLFLAACRKKEEPIPTAVATAIVPDVLPTETVEPEPSKAPSTPIPRATATTEPRGTEGIDPDLIDWPPQVVYSSPAPGEEVVLNGAITIRFDQAMDQGTVEDAFEVRESDGNEAAIDGSFTWPRPDTLIFTPRNELKRKQTYRINIGQQASSAKGFTLDEPLELFLQTVGYLEVSQVIPGEGVEDVQTDSAITVLFNRPVVPLVASGQQAGLPQPLAINPPITGQGEWVSTSIYRFVPDQPLAGAARYQVQVTTDFEDITGHVLEEPFDWGFTTMRPAVVTIEPENGTADFAPSQPVTITFNMPMNRSVTESAVSVRTAGSPPVALDYNWSDGDRVLTLDPQEQWAFETAYQIGIAQAASSTNGAATLERDVLSGFNTVPFPSVVSTFPGRGELAERWQRGFTVNFASPMDWDTLDGRLQIAPDPGDVDYYFYENQLNVSFELERNAEYIITVPGDAADPYGNLLGEDYTWRFTTPGNDPLASLNLPQQISQVSTSFPTKVDIINRNVSRIDVALYDLGVPLNLINEPYTVNDFRPAASSLRTWSVTPDVAPEQVDVLALQLADGNALPTGIYLITLDSPETGENVRFWQNQRHLLMVVDTNIVVKEMFGEVRVWVTGLASGQPAAGRNLTLYNSSGVQVGTAVSDANGFARFENPPDDYLSGVTVVSNQPGQTGFGVGRSLWNPGVDPWRFGLDYRSDPEPPIFAYFYTDRPIYRPGDTIYYKGIVRDPNYGRYSLPGVQTVELSISTASFFGEPGLEETFTVQLDESGTFNGEFVLPDDVQLGTYQFFVGQDFNSARQFTVAEYRKPEFLVTITPDQAEVLRGQQVDVVLETSYFFGGPATDLEVNWYVYEDNYHVDVPGPFYYFDDGGDFYYEDFGPFGFGGGGGTFGDMVLNGVGRTGGDGRLTISLPADLLKDVEEGSRLITVEAQVNDLANFPVTALNSVVMHAAETYVGIVPVNYIPTAGTTAEFDLLTVDWVGQSVSNQNVEVIYYAREWKRDRNAQFGMYFTSWEPVDTEVARDQVATNNQGKAVSSFVPETGGIYLAVATVTDNGGRTHTSSTIVWVTDSQYVGWRTDPKERRMDLVVDSQEYHPGDIAQILVQSPFAGPVKAWLTIERGTLIEQRVVTLETSSEVLEIPISADYAPNVYVSLTVVKGVTTGGLDDPYADIRLGITELVVTPEQLELNLTMTPQEEMFMPGETAVYDIQVTDFQGNPVEAELSLALVDLAVLTLKEDNAPPIIDGFYSKQPYRSQVGSGLFVSGEGLEVEIPVEALGRGGGGGGEAPSLAVGKVEEDEEDVRRDFPDTAFWEASIKTDANGQAVVEIPLPDSLTTWRLSSKAFSEETPMGTLVGQSSVDIVVTLPLLIRPVTPRFFTVGDVIHLGAIINNNTGQAIEATVSLEAGGLTLHDAAEQAVTIPANGRQIVRWQSLVDDVEFADLTFRVNGGEYNDATKPSFGEGDDNLIPVYRYDAEDIVGTSGVLTEAGRRVEAILLPPGIDTREGEVTVNLSPSLAAALIEALQYNNNLEYLSVCAHAIIDRLLPNVAIARAIEDLGLDKPILTIQLNELIRESIDQLELLAKADGGWGWCFSEESDDWITAYGLFALVQADQAGFSVDPATMNAATAFLSGNLANSAALNDSFQVNRQAFFLYVLAESGVDVTNDANELFQQHRSLLDPYARGFLALAFHVAGGGGNNIQTLLADLNDSIILIATGGHWEDISQDVRNLNSDVRGTAIIIDALSRIEPDNGLIPQALRWLMVARKAQHWSTGHETAWSILALSDWMLASGELDADYEYQLNLNAARLLEGSFTPENITDNEVVSIGISELAVEDVNFVDFQRGLGDGRLYYTLHLDSSINAETVQAASHGISVQRVYYDAGCDPETEDCQPIDRIEAGQQVRVELTIIAANDLVYAMIEDPFPAGAEGIDPNLETSGSQFGSSISRNDYQYGYWGWWFFNRIEYRDEKVVFLSEFLPAGTYQYTYFLQTNIPGEYQVRPAIAMQEFFPEVFGRSEGMLFTIFE